MASETGTCDGASTRVVRTVSFDPIEDDPVRVVAELLAEEFDAEPAELQPPLEMAIDCDLLVKLLADEQRRESLVRFSFTYRNFRIVFDGPERVRLLSVDS